MHLQQVRDIVSEVLALGPAGQQLRRESALLGSIPELDSMAVVQLIASLEEYFGMQVDDGEISAATFATLGSLADFIEHKVAA